MKNTDKQLQKGANLERASMRKKIKRMEGRFKKEKKDAGVEACLEMWEFLRYREPRNTKKRWWAVISTINTEDIFMAKPGLTIQLVTVILNENTGDIEDSHVTRVTGQSEERVKKWKQDFAAFGAAQMQVSAADGTPESQLHFYRHKGNKHGGRPK